MVIKITTAGLWLHNESGLKIIDLPSLKTVSMQWLENTSKTFEPTYLYTIEKGYFLLPESAKSLHNIHSMNVSFSARHSCFGNWWQQIVINRFVGYDTIIMNSLLSSNDHGYLYNYQTKEFHNLSHSQVPKEGAKLGDRFVTKCGILIMSFFVFLSTTTIASFVLREAQSRLLKFTVQLQQYALHGLPPLQQIFIGVLEPLLFAPIIIGTFIFLFKFYDDQLLAFMVLALVWLCELFTLFSVHTPISMKYFPCFFLVYFLVFHMYFFFYPYGFSYMALATTAAFSLHLIIFFWNRFEVPAYQRHITHIQGTLPNQQQEFQVTQSTVVATTFHITRLNNARDQGLANTNQNGEAPGNPNPNVGFMNSLSSLLRWIFEGASSGLNSFLSMFSHAHED